MRANEAVAVLRRHSSVSMLTGYPVIGEAMRQGAEAIELLAFADTDKYPEIRKWRDGKWRIQTALGETLEFDTFLETLRQAKKASGV